MLGEGGGATWILKTAAEKSCVHLKMHVKTKNPDHSPFPLPSSFTPKYDFTIK